MPVEVIMPKVDMDMASGKIMVWHVAEGQKVEKGAPLFDIETDKAAMEVEALGSGILHHPAEAGSDVAIGQPIGWLYAEDEDVGSAPDSIDQVTTVEEIPTVEQAEPETKATDSFAPVIDKIRATPLARRIAKQRGLDLSSIVGTGPRGRIGRSDVEAFESVEQTQESFFTHQITPPAPAQASDGVMAAYAGRDFVETPLDGMRRTVAARLTEAKQNVPHFYLRRSIEIDGLLDLRASMNEQLADRDIKLTINDFIIKACAVSLQQVPQANVVWAGDRVLQFQRSDITVAVSVDGGLFTPVICDADTKSLASLSGEMKALAVKARDKKLKPDEYTGGSLSISNLGMFGVEDFDAIINPPQAAILAVGAATQRKLLSKSGEERLATVMRVSLSVDHRTVDGALGAQFLAAIVENLENPFAMLA